MSNSLALLLDTSLCLKLPIRIDAQAFKSLRSTIAQPLVFIRLFVDGQDLSLLPAAAPLVKYRSGLPLRCLTIPLVKPVVKGVSKLAVYDCR